MKGGLSRRGSEHWLIRAVRRVMEKKKRNRIKSKIWGLQLGIIISNWTFSKLRKKLKKPLIQNSLMG